MANDGRLAYAAARIHAHQGLRLSGSDWRRLESTPHAGQYLEMVRAGPLAPWVAGLEAASDPHSIERALRSAWRAYARAVASWHPRVWQPWLEWWAWLPLLPLIARLALPVPVPGWMLLDPVCAPVAPGSPAERASALEATALAPLAAAVRSAAAIAPAWSQEALRRMAPGDRRTGERLGLLIALLAPARGGGAASADPLQRLFRSAADTVVASGCHLAQMLMDLERLRGGLVLRSLFTGPDPGEG